MRRRVRTVVLAGFGSSSVSWKIGASRLHACVADGRNGTVPNLGTCPW
jgi:hypothetical protein